MRTFRYVGSKVTLAAEIIRHFPPHRCFVDVFGGSGVVLLNKPPSTVEVFNDINGDVVNFFNVMRTQYKAFAAQLEFVPYSRELFDKWLEDWKSGNYPEDAVERALRWYCLRSWGFSGGLESWSHGTNHNCARYFNNRVQELRFVCARLKQVQIEHRDFEYIFLHYDSPDTLFYCDPPYLVDGVDTGRGYYNCRFTLADHERLARMANDCKGKVVLSYYPVGAVYRLYPQHPQGKWHYSAVTTYKFAEMAKGKKRQKAIELIIANFPPTLIKRKENLI